MLLGRKDLEDALKRLDKLTQDEARMAIAQNLKATRAVSEQVRGVATGVVGVDDRVARVEHTVTNVKDRVVSIDDRVAGVDDRVVGVDERVKAIDDKVAAVADGKKNVLSQPPTVNLSSMYLDAKEGRTITRQTANDVDQVIRLSLPNLINVNSGA